VNSRCWSQVAYHHGSVVTGDDSSIVSRKQHTSEVHTGIDEHQQARSAVVGNFSTAKECSGVSIYTDPGAAGVNFAPVPEDLISPRKYGVAIAVHIYPGAGVIRNLRIQQTDLAAGADGDTDGTVSADESINDIPLIIECCII
jgi:hypothetical protein